MYMNVYIHMYSLTFAFAKLEAEVNLEGLPLGWTDTSSVISAPI